MRAGELRHRVDIEERRTIYGTRGEALDQWQKIGTVWASIETLSGTELDRARTTLADATHVVTLRYRPGITERTRFKFGERYFHVGHVNQVDQRKEMILATCGEER